jgi:hypothetical protein
MKATIDVPDELYRSVKAKSAREGRALREITVELYQRYIGEVEAPESTSRRAEAAGDRPAGRVIPSWFGALGRTARDVKQHDMDTIRESLGRGIARDRDL